MDNPTEFQTEDVLTQFREEEAGYLMWLISEGELRGNVLEVIRKEVRARYPSEFSLRNLWTLFLPAQLSVTCVNGRCNLACRMCTGSPKGTLSYLPAVDLYMMLSHLPGVETTVLVANDAEPLLNPEFADLMKVLAEFRQRAMLITNGHLLDPRRIEILANYPFALDVGVSLDAATQSTYHRIRGASLKHSFDNVLRLSQAKHCNNAPHSLSLLMVGMEDNIEELPAFVEMAAEARAHRVKLDHMGGNFTPGDFVRHPRWREILSDAVALANQLGVRLVLPPDAAKEIDVDRQAHVQGSFPVRCDWQRRMAVDMNGDIHPCCWTRTVQLGNLLRTPIYHNDAYFQLRASMEQGGILKECETMPNCGYVQSLIKNGKLHVPRPGLHLPIATAS